jgi:DNA-binding transcriptional ArsR family regulator
MRTSVGVIGPSDLVSLVEQVAGRDFPHLEVRGSTYRNESEAVELVRDHSADVDAWLFTGVIPYTLAAQAGVLDRPATYITYTGATLYRLMVGLLSSGRTIDAISIDTLDRDQVVEAFRDAALPVDGVRVMEYRAGHDAARFAEFHRATARTAAAGSVAITCVRSVYDEICGEMEAIRLAPAIASVRSALQTITLASIGRVSADAQVVLGFIDVSDPDPELADDITALAGSLFTLQEGRYLLVTTRGVLEETTNQFQHLPLLTQLSRRHLWAHVGLGVGRSAAEAEALARRALARSRASGPFSAVVSLGNGGDVMLAEADPDEVDPGEPVPLAVAARRSGLSRHTLDRLKGVLDRHGDEGITVGDVAEALDIEARSARRTLKRLERAGVAQPIGRVLAGTTGRPPTVYRVRLG